MAKQLTKKEVEELSKEIIQKELKKRVEDIVRDELKNKATEKIIIQVVKNAMSSLYKTLWMRRATWLSGIENKDS